MKKSSGLKASLFAAASLSAAMIATHATASDTGSTPVAPIAAIEHSIVSSDHSDEIAGPVSAKKWMLGAAAAGVLAAILRLTGLSNLMGGLKKVGPAVAKAATVAATASVKAVKVVGSSLSSPLRFALSMVGLGAFAFTGVAVFDLEWTGGLIVGAVLTASAWWSSTKMRRMFALRPIRSKAR